MKAIRPKLQPSPSLLPITLPRNIPPTQGDDVLIQCMDGGKRPDIAIEAGNRPLVISLNEYEEKGSCSPSSTETSDATMDSPAMSPKPRPVMPPAIDHKSLSVNVLSTVQAPAMDQLRDVQKPSERELVPENTFSSKNLDLRMSLHQQQLPAHSVPVWQKTIPQAPTFACEFAGCNAAPFRTQFMLNFHAKVHSSERPHYCAVHGCPRGKGGKGFKRKNEMIRHSLTHESPGYVCPFCSDSTREYARADNLQR